MADGEIDKTNKEPEVLLPTSNNAQELSSSTSTATVNADWPGYQAYSPIPPHGFLASSPQAHPYVWGVQPIMPPYGTPHPYVAMYPHGGMYAHPSMPSGSYPFGPFPMPSADGVVDASGNTPGGAEDDAKVPEGKEKLPVKRSKVSLGCLNMITCNSNEDGKTTRPSDGSSSKSAESACDGTSQGSDTDSHNNSPMKSGESQEAHQADEPQNGTSAHITQNGALNAPHTTMNHALTIVPLTAPGTPASIPGPTTNLNIGMDYWAPPAVPGKVSSAPVAAGIVPTGSRDHLQSQLWLQDDRELKRQRRKQSNRESALRSRLRKQAECDELAQHTESLKDENASLRSELNRIRSEYEKLSADNSSLKERLGGASEDLGSSRGKKHATT